jgi:hypothetical protein
MRTTLDLPEREIDELVKLTGATSKTAAIVWAVEEAIRAKRRERLLGMGGKVAFVPGYDVRRLRELEVKQRRKQLGLD